MVHPGTALVVYDSAFGNTEQVARAIAAALPAGMEPRAVRAGLLDAADAAAVALLIVGSPTNGGRPTKQVQSFLDRLGRLAAGTRVAAFDTRSTMKFARIFGYAAPRIADVLRAKGGTLAAPPEAFIVNGRADPLARGEIEHAGAWARKLAL